jgi:Tfp pilus assembly protein PilX
MNNIAAKRASSPGQVLVGVIMLMMLLLIIVPAMVQWIQQESRASVKEQKSSTAYNLAEAAVDRGMWKLKSATSTWASALGAVVIPGYNFDVTYTDVSSGTYRIKFSSGVFGGVAVVTVWGEGRDSLRKETRSIQAVYQNTSIPGAIIAGAALSQSGSAIAIWGPVMAMNNITLSGSALTRHSPRALSKQTVLPYDTNGVTPPNTDGYEWWSAYDVPELPVFDFAAMRSSAAATNTLNCNGAYSAITLQVPCGTCAPGAQCLVTNMHKDNRADLNYIWYWDPGTNVNLVGTGIRGTTIARGNLWAPGDDYYGTSPARVVNMHVPSAANLEYRYPGFDLASTNQYAGDTGLHTSAANYVLGSCSSACEGSASGSDLGFYGFVYVGGSLNFSGASDIYGAAWVAGDWAAAGNNMVFYDDSLTLPTLNVVLVRKSWTEVTPSTLAWP